MFDYYWELLSKPSYQLSESEKMFLDIFPVLVIGAVCFVVFLVCRIVKLLKGGRK